MAQNGCLFKRTAKFLSLIAIMTSCALFEPTMSFAQTDQPIIMAEASEAVTDYWFDVLGKTVLHVPKAAENTASRRISERSGMRVVDTMERDYVAGRLLAEVWEITRDEWHARKRTAATGAR